jgi:hypothetical protein
MVGWYGNDAASHGKVHLRPVPFPTAYDISMPQSGYVVITAEKPQPRAMGSRPSKTQGPSRARDVRSLASPRAGIARCSSACLVHVACLTYCGRYRSDTNKDRSGGGQLRQMLEGARTQEAMRKVETVPVCKSDRDSRLPTDKMLQPIRHRVIRRCFLLGTPAEKAGSDVIRGYLEWAEALFDVFPAGPDFRYPFHVPFGTRRGKWGFSSFEKIKLGVHPSP